MTRPPTHHHETLAAFERDGRRLNLAPGTCANRLRVAAAFLARLRTPLAELGPDHVRAYLARRQRQGVSRGTQANDLSALRALCRFLQLQGVLAADPTAGLAVVRKTVRPPLLLSQEAVVALLHVADAPPPNSRSRRLALRDRALVELLYGLGLRASEACAARLRDLSLAEGTLVVRRAKRGESRALPIPPRTVAALRAYLDAGRPQLAHRAARDAGHLLLSQRGRPLSTASLTSVVRKLAQRAGLRAHPHAFRRALASHLVASGVPVRAVQELLGHRDLQTTAAYVEVDHDALRRAVEVLDSRPPAPANHRGRFPPGPATLREEG